MSNELQSLSQLFQNRLFRIPDYQRGYAWTQPQLVDFWEDLVNMQPDHYHYTGLLSLKPMKATEVKSWGDDLWLVDNGYKPCHIVDGQQRITTFVIFINEIVLFVRSLKENYGKSDKDIVLGFETIDNIVSTYICRKRPPNNILTTYLFGYEADNPSSEYMRYKVFEESYSGNIEETYYTKNLKLAKEFFADNIKEMFENSGENGLEALNRIYKNLTQHMMFNIYEIDDDYDVFVAFETMNNRGKKLTNLELLKNRLIYLTTLYDEKALDIIDKTTLRKKINSTWKEVYFQLGRNIDTPLSDDEYLRAHWIIYFTYSRKRGDDYIKYLLHKFSPKEIYEKKTVLIETESDYSGGYEFNESESDISNETYAEEPESKEISKLQPFEIRDYVDSLKELAKYWYDSYFPFECSDLSLEEQKCIDRLNRIGIGYFRPLVVAVISRKDISKESKTSLFESIERFIFVAFRMGNFNSNYGSSDYYRVAHQVYNNEEDIDDLSQRINKKTTDDAGYAVQNFTSKISKFFSDGNGFYDWSGLRYFFYEYESNLAIKNNLDRFRAWSMFTKSERDKISIEHILPQTPTKEYWKKRFEKFNQDEIKKLSGAIGNLLPLSQSINSSLQNDSFDDKKHEKENGRRGYENGSHSEIEVSKISEWTAEEIYNRSKELIGFLKKHWNINISDEQEKALIGLSFLNVENKELSNNDENI